MFTSRSYPSFLGLALILGHFVAPLRGYAVLPRAIPNIGILAGSANGACSATQITAIENNIPDAISMATAGSTALQSAGVTQSQSFRDFLGATNNPQTINAAHFSPIASNLKLPLKHVQSIGTGDNDLTFICPPTCKNFFAVVANRGDKTQAGTPATGNIVQFCPFFFGNGGAPPPITLSQAGPLYVAGQKMGNVPAMTLFHEFQHSIPMIGAQNIVKDLKVGSARAYSVPLCISLPDNQKILNAQNFAWFAFEAAVAPDRTKPCAATNTGTTTTNAHSISPKADTEPKISFKLSPRQNKSPAAKPCNTNPTRGSLVFPFPDYDG